MAKSRRDEVLEEVEWLLSFGVVPEDIAQRLGYGSVASLERAVYRYGNAALGTELHHRQETYIACHKDYEVNVGL